MADLKANYRKGDPLRAADLNAIVEALGIDLVGGAGLAVRKSGRRLQITGQAGAGGYLAKADGAITARSGTTPGTGTAAVQWIDNTGVLADAGISVAVYNADAAAGIDAGKYCWVEYDAFGVAWVGAMECNA